MNGEGNVNSLVRRAFHQFFTGYSMAFNNCFERKGNLFHRPFKRKEIGDDEQLKDTILYIHTNLSKHNLDTHFMDYKWSSFNEITAFSNTRLLRSEVQQLFENQKSYLDAHHSYNEKRWLHPEPPLFI